MLVCVRCGLGGRWTYAFISEVLLVNLLIAMMTETYDKISKNKDDEYQFQRILIVDEFMGSVYPLPPPLSLPTLLRHLARALPAWAAHLRRPDDAPRPAPDESYEDAALV